MKRKTNTEIAEAIFIAKKNNLNELATAISKPTRQQVKVNILDLNKVKEETIIVPGKVLSLGEPEKKVKVYALSFSEKAMEKLKAKGCEVKTILEALKENSKLKGEILN